MHKPGEIRTGVFYPDEIQEMVEELKLGAAPSDKERDKEERAAAIVRSRMERTDPDIK